MPVVITIGSLALISVSMSSCGTRSVVIQCIVLPAPPVSWTVTVGVCFRADTSTSRTLATPSPARSRFTVASSSGICVGEDGTTCTSLSLPFSTSATVSANHIALLSE
ncbi:hypothetical protein OHA91_35830 [Streptomyces erythrochromogenes]|uniref:Secreted protein n=1 Tax=Streptomyces erythrochromogenes TaxID=285574 RepID=A0ABZ1QLZ2_9ACTN|nr:hypothetical protein [Streptomyces erythrochromogenes]